jgi:hypothetical protein
VESVQGNRGVQAELRDRSLQIAGRICGAGYLGTTLKWLYRDPLVDTVVNLSYLTLFLDSLSGSTSLRDIKEEGLSKREIQTLDMCKDLAIANAVYYSAKAVMTGDVASSACEFGLTLSTETAVFSGTLIFERMTRIFGATYADLQNGVYAHGSR